jgi:hypothetical protein
MRRLTVALALALATAAVFAATALAKEGGVELSSTPYGSQPGDPWTGTMTLVGGDEELVAQAKPAITIRNLATGERENFFATPTKRADVWDFSVTFPEAGRYAVTVGDGVTGRSYSFPPVRIGDPTLAPPASPTSDATGSFPVWTLVGGLLGAFAAIGATIVLIRRRQLRLSH